MADAASSPVTGPGSSSGPSVISADTSAGLIEIRIQRVEQLFNSFDPSPFHERDLDDDAEDYIVSWARELPRDRAIRIVIHLPGAESLKAGERGVPKAVQSYFAGRAARLGLDLRELFRLGWRFLLIGLPVLALCLVASRYVPIWLGDGALAKTIAESLVIVGWVANWKPLEVFLYDWWPIWRRKTLYQRLAAAGIELRST